MKGLFNLAVSHNKKINIPESILKLSEHARVEYSSGGSNNNRNGVMTTKYYYKHWKYIPNVSINYINQKIPNNGASNSICYVNFKTGNTAIENQKCQSITDVHDGKYLQKIGEHGAG